MDKEKWVFIINPVAGKGFAASMNETIGKEALKRGINPEFAFTQRKGHATLLSERFVSEGYKYIIGVGGDGTFNEVATPLVGNNSVVTGLVAAGTGNDFIQILGFPDRFGDSEWDALFSAHTVAMDAGKCNNRLFFNGMGLGFDAKVASENYTPEGEVKPGSKKKYIWHILKTILFYKERRMIVYNDGNRSETDCFINTVSNGRRYAGGFYLTPEAIANDGLLDICSVRKIGLYQRLRILTMVPSGRHIHDRRVHYYKTTGLLIEFSERVPYHLDGELYFDEKFEIKVIPQALNVIYNPAGRHYFNIP